MRYLPLNVWYKYVFKNEQNFWFHIVGFQNSGTITVELHFWMQKEQVYTDLKSQF